VRGIPTCRASRAGRDAAGPSRARPSPARDPTSPSAAPGRKRESGTRNHPEARLVPWMPTHGTQRASIWKRRWSTGTPRSQGGRRERDASGGIAPRARRAAAYWRSVASIQPVQFAAAPSAKPKTAPFATESGRISPIGVRFRKACRSAAPTSPASPRLSRMASGPPRRDTTSRLTTTTATGTSAIASGTRRRLPGVAVTACAPRGAPGRGDASRWPAPPGRGCGRPRGRRDARGRTTPPPRS